MDEEHPQHPGEILKERFLDPLGVTPAELASSIGVSTRRIADLVRGRRRISTDTAIRLGLYFSVPPAWWLDMQSRYDTEGSALFRRLRECVKPHAGLDQFLVTPSGVQLLPGTRRHEPGPMLVHIPDDLLARLQAQAALGRPRPPRRVRTVTYTNGATALVGVDDEPDR